MTATGILLGLLIGHGGLALAVGPFREATGLLLDAWQFPRSELLAVLTMAGCGAIASLFPAISCYKNTPIQGLQLSE